MEQNILDLLKENNRAIIPDFGAFFIRQDDPREIAFNGLLTFNDGMLIELTSKSEGLTYNDAILKVENYAKQLISELNKSKQVTINQIGKIIIDKSGEKQFTPWKDLDEKDTIITEDTASATVKAKKKQTKQVEEEIEDEVSEIKEKKEDEAAAKKENEKETVPTASKEKEEAKEAEKKEEEVLSKPEKKKKKETVPPASEKKEKTAAEKKEKTELTSKEKKEEEIVSSTEKGKKKETIPPITEEKEDAEEAKKKKEKVSPEEVKAETKPGKEEKPEIVTGPGKKPIPDEKSSFTLDESLKEVDIDASDDSVKHIINKKQDGAESLREPFSLEESSEEKTLTAEAAGTKESASPDDYDLEGSKESEPETGKYESTTLSISTPVHPPARKKRRWILPVGIACSLFIIIAAAWLIFPDEIRSIFKSEQSAEEKLTPSEDVAITAEESQDISSPTETGLDEAGTTETVSPPKEVTETTERETPSSEIISSGPKYYVVAGCFENRENADRYIDELQAQGYNAELFGTWKNLYAVSFNSFTTKDQALQEMLRIRQSAEPDAWVLYY